LPFKRLKRFFNCNKTRLERDQQKNRKKKKKKKKKKEKNFAAMSKMKDESHKPMPDWTKQNRQNKQGETIQKEKKKKKKSFEPLFPFLCYPFKSPRQNTGPETRNVFGRRRWCKTANSKTKGGLLSIGFG
jgi:hypothetical protein